MPPGCRVQIILTDGALERRACRRGLARTHVHARTCTHAHGRASQAPWQPPPELFPVRSLSNHRRDRPRCLPAVACARSRVESRAREEDRAAACLGGDPGKQGRGGVRRKEVLWAPGSRLAGDLQGMAECAQELSRQTTGGRGLDLRTLVLLQMLGGHTHGGRYLVTVPFACDFEDSTQKEGGPPSCSQSHGRLRGHFTKSI